MKFWDNIQPEKIKLAYEGPISNRVISRLAEQIDREFQAKERIKRKLFSIFIEFAQNILFYSPTTHFANSRVKMSYFIIHEAQNAWILSAGNYIQNNKIENLKQRCLVINSLNTSELRKYRLDIIARPWAEKTKGAGIGLIKVALISNNHLEFTINKINDQLSFLTLSTKILK